MITQYANWLKRGPSWLYKLAAQSYIDYQFPRHIFLELNASCNLSCDYCPREKRKEEMEWPLFTKIVDEAKNHGPRSFSLHLFGEPFLCSFLFEAIAYIKESNKKNTVLLTTNGTMLEKNGNLEKLLGSRVDVVLWSWRPEAQFSKETKERLKAWGKFRVRFIKEVTPKEAYEEWRDWPNIEGRNLHNYAGNINTARWKVPAVKTDIRWPCYHLWLAPAIAWNGKFLLCCADPHQKEVFGNVNVEQVAEAWQRVNSVRRSHLKGEYKGICGNCDVWAQYPDLFFSFQRTG